MSFLDAPGRKSPGQTMGKIRNSGYLMLAVLIFLYLFNAFDRTVLSLMVPYVKSDLGVTDAQMGLMLGLAFALFYGVSSVPFGVLVDRYSRRLVLVFGVLLWSLATIACGIANSFLQLLGARMVLGIGESALMPAAHSLLVGKFGPERAGTALSIFYLGGIFGNAIAVVLGGWLIAHFSELGGASIPLLGEVRGWQMPFILVGVAGLFAASTVFLFKNPPRAKRDPATKADVSILQFLFSRRAVSAAIFGTFVLYAMILYAVVMWAPTYMARAFDWNPAQIGGAFSIIHVAGAAVGTVATGLIVDRLFRVHKDAHFRILIAGLVIGGPAGIIAFSTTNPTIFVICATVLFMCAFSYAGYGAAAVQVISPASMRGRMAAIYLLSVTIIGAGLGPWIVGLLTDNLFGDDSKVGLSLILMIAVTTPISILSAVLGLKPLREAVMAVEELESLLPDSK